MSVLFLFFFAALLGSRVFLLWSSFLSFKIKTSCTRRESDSISIFKNDISNEMGKVIQKDLRKLSANLVGGKKNI